MKVLVITKDIVNNSHIIKIFILSTQGYSYLILRSTKQT